MTKPRNPGGRRAPLSEMQKARGVAAGRMLRTQIRSHGVNMGDLHEVMGLKSKTTLANHIRSGKVTLLELCEINDFVQIDVNAILDLMRSDRIVQPSRSRTEIDVAVDYDDSVQEPDFDMNDPQVAALAERFGFTSWGEE